jgi:hypothetical protein
MTENTNAAPVGLRQARKEQAAAKAASKAAHPAGKQTPAKKAPAKKAPAKAADKPTRTTLRWVFPEGRDTYPDGKVQVAPYGAGELAILKDGDGWKAVYREGGKVVETLATGAFGKCYGACTRRAKGQAA